MEPPKPPAMPEPEFGLLTRWILFALGVWIMTVGVALSIRAGLGASPISTVPASLAGSVPLSFGVLSILMNIVFVVVQAVLLRRRFRPINLLQIPAAVFFGWMCDVSLHMTSFLHPEGYLQQWLLVILAALLVALGVFVEVLPRILYLPGEGVVSAIAMVSGWRFGTVKQCFDWSLVIMAVILSLALAGELQGVREGTVFAAFAVGGLVKVYQRLWTRLRARRRR